MSENVQPPPTQILHSSNSFLTRPTIRPVHGDTSYQTYDDFRASVLAPPAALTTQNPRGPTRRPAQELAPYVPHHRRANTEVITRQAPLLSRPPIEHCKTLEDLGEKDSTHYPIAENLTRKKLEVGGRILVDWFHGKSEPVNIGVLPSPTKETAATMSSDSYTEKRNSRELYESPAPSAVPMNRLQKRMTAPSPLKQVTSTNPFSFFGSKKQDERRVELPEPANDEFLNLDITAALFPPRLSSGDSQEAFECLQANAENTLRRLQAAYKDRTFALHEALAEKTEQQEELEETRTRVQHIKIQLDGMAEKVLEQDKAMKAMAQELEQEREARRKEDEARRRTVALVKASDNESLADLGSDLETPKRHSKRASAATFTSDSGFESGDESPAESIFSRRHECLGSPVSTFASPSPNDSQITLPVPLRVTMQPPEKESKPTLPPQRQSAYDRVMKGLTSTGLAGGFIGGGSKCSNCHGVPASEAWSVIGVLKEESKGLKGRIGELETVIDDCLSLVGP